MRLIFGILSLIAVFFFLFLFEGICFRMVEKYSLMRLKSSWGEKNSVDLNKYLKLFPLNHFQKAPTDSSEVEFSMFRAIEEDKYARKIMSFGRPQRDRFVDFIEDIEPNGKSFAIKDIKHIRGLILPGLKRFPTDEEVAKGWAGRQRDSIEFAQAIFVDLKPFTISYNSNSQSQYEKRHQDYLLEHGFACLSLPTRSKDMFVNDLRILKESFPAVAEKIICRANGREAEILLDACSDYPFLVNMLIVHSPTGFSSVPQVESPPWFFCSVDKNQMEDYVLVDGLLKWISAVRDTKFIYPSKIGGLMRVRDTYSSKNIDTFHIPILMQCVSFFQRLSEEKARSFALKESIVNQAKKNVASKRSTDKNSIEVPDSLSIKSIKSELSNLGTTTNSAQSYDCKMVREYRQLHFDDPSITQADNRELILKIGLNFEQMEPSVMQEVRQKDPLFFQFYQSLKVIEE
jgi:hypothetical protein